MPDSSLHTVELKIKAHWRLLLSQYKWLRWLWFVSMSSISLLIGCIFQPISQKGAVVLIFLIIFVVAFVFFAVCEHRYAKKQNARFSGLAWGLAGTLLLILIVSNAVRSHQRQSYVKRENDYTNRIYVLTNAFDAKANDEKIKNLEKLIAEKDSLLKRHGNPLERHNLLFYWAQRQYGETNFRDVVLLLHQAMEVEHLSVTALTQTKVFTPLLYASELMANPSVQAQSVFSNKLDRFLSERTRTNDPLHEIQGAIETITKTPHFPPVLLPFLTNSWWATDLKRTNYIVP